MVTFNDKRPVEERTNQLFFAVFEWRDPFIQEIRLVSSPETFSSSLKCLKSSSVCQSLTHLFFTSGQLVTANPWSSVAILCGVFMALFKAANFAKLTIQWIIRMRKRHLRNKQRELNPITDNWRDDTLHPSDWSAFVFLHDCVLRGHRSHIL